MKKYAYPYHKNSCFKPTYMLLFYLLRVLITPQNKIYSMEKFKWATTFNKLSTDSNSLSL